MIVSEVFGEEMLTISDMDRIFICNTPKSIRKSFEGLSTIIQEKFPGELLKWSFLIFLNGQRYHMKVMFWDKDRLMIFYKRLEKRSFLYKWGDTTSVDRGQFFTF